MTPYQLSLCPSSQPPTRGLSVEAIWLGRCRSLGRSSQPPTRGLSVEACPFPSIPELSSLVAAPDEGALRRSSVTGPVPAGSLVVAAPDEGALRRSQVMRVADHEEAVESQPPTRGLSVEARTSVLAPRSPGRASQECQWPSVSPHWRPLDSPLVAIISPRWRRRGRGRRPRVIMRFSALCITPGCARRRRPRWRSEMCTSRADRSGSCT